MVKVSAAMVEFCPGMSTAATLSRVPEACGLARFRKEAKATTMPSTTMAMTRILPEGRFFLAVPYSSPMLMVGPDGWADGVAGGWGAAGGEGGFDMEFSFTPRFYANAEWSSGRRDTSAGRSLYSALPLLVRRAGLMQLCDDLQF